MGTIADSLFAVLMSWVRALVSSFWALFSSENTTVLEFLGRNWIVIAVVLVAVGLVIDWAVWMIRWQPYQLWAVRLRRLLRLPDPEEDEDADEDDEEALRRRREELYAAPAQDDEDDDGVRLFTPARAQRAAQDEYDQNEYDQDEYDLNEYDQDGAGEEAYAPDAGEDSWLPLAPVFDEAEEEQVMRAAQDVPDEELTAYPGMRYGAQPREEGLDGGTQRYAAVHSEGPGAAEVMRRRGEIDAWKRRMQEEARLCVQAEREAREAENRAREEQEAEQARLTQAAWEAEQARLAQEEYERQMEEYERQKAQYERDLAEYERQKAAYDAAQAEAAAREAAREAEMEFAQEFYAQPGRQRRRRTNSASYSDLVQGEGVEELPPPPQWPKMSPAAVQEAQTAEAPKDKKERKLLYKVARMMEPEEEELAGLPTLPPRVDMKDAYKPARKPHKPGRRNR